jgi:hypothetical protein
LTLEVESQTPDGFEKPDAISICFDVRKFIQRFKPLAHDVSALASDQRVDRLYVLLE